MSLRPLRQRAVTAITRPGELIIPCGHAGNGNGNNSHLMVVGNSGLQWGYLLAPNGSLTPPSITYQSETRGIVQFRADLGTPGWFWIVMDSGIEPFPGTEVVAECPEFTLDPIVVGIGGASWYSVNSNLAGDYAAAMQARGVDAELSWHIEVRAL